jgi:hypothetical protein
MQKKKAFGLWLGPLVGGVVQFVLSFDLDFQA